MIQFFLIILSVFVQKDIDINHKWSENFLVPNAETEPTTFTLRQHHQLQFITY